MARSCRFSSSLSHEEVEDIRVRKQEPIIKEEDATKQVYLTGLKALARLHRGYTAHQGASEADIVEFIGKKLENIQAIPKAGIPSFFKTAWHNF